ncbi:unnamed protein product [Rhizoctonia solani]|uniref:Peptidase M20 domain-containing protein 2 n=1 Tax=Rhizoctonia solani TaxID=456999 RepID=A0A8H3B0J5_9AGAM|nr:unnamed protein product [Rhizoctonia solani]
MSIVVKRYAHDTLTQFVEKQGFQVTRHYFADQLPGDTAWKAEFAIPDKSGKALPAIGFNSEMDALPGIGHACGHNLIAIVGVAAALGLKSAMEKHNIPGKIILLGTPAEEKGLGKLDPGFTNSNKHKLRAHPVPGDSRLVETTTSLAMHTLGLPRGREKTHWMPCLLPTQQLVLYVSRYTPLLGSTGLLKGVIGHQTASEPPFIPNYAKMRYAVRAPTWDEVTALRARVNKCFEAGAHATSCTMTMTGKGSMKDVRVNEVLSSELGAIMAGRYNHPFNHGGVFPASTDFGNVTYALPALHPIFAIPTVPNGGNHTPEFTAAARTQEAHERAIMASKGLATLGLRALLDEQFLLTVKNHFKDAALPS